MTQTVTAVERWEVSELGACRNSRLAQVGLWQLSVTYAARRKREGFSGQEWAKWGDLAAIIYLSFLLRLVCQVLKTPQGTLPIATLLRQVMASGGSLVFHLSFRLTLLWGRTGPLLVYLEQSVKGSKLSSPIPGELPYLTLGKSRTRFLSPFLSSHFLPQI